MFFADIKMTHRDVGLYGDHWIISDGPDSVRVGIADAKDLANRLKTRSDKAVDDWPIEAECMTVEARPVMLKLNGRLAKIIIANILG